MSYYPFGIEDFKMALQMDGRKIVRAGKGILTQCLIHSEKNPSAEVFPDGWIACYSCAKRYHISNYYPTLRDPNWKPDYSYTNQEIMPKPVPVAEESQKIVYQEYDLMPEWEKMELIPRDHNFKGLPLEVLDDLGWRWTEGVAGMGRGYFIPYFNSTKDKIPFAQVRHLTGERRFSMLPNAKMQVYGKWNLYDGEKVFIVEGPSDGAILTAAMMPWVAIPSASSTNLIVGLAKVCLKHGIAVIYSGDNDEAGDKLRQALDEVIPYRVCQPPKEYKDWGDYYVATNLETVHNRLNAEYMEHQPEPIVGLADEVFNGNQRSLL